MKLGYYFTNSKYGTDYKEVRGFAPIYRCGRLDYQTSETARSETDALFQNALVEACSYKHTQVVLSLDWSGFNDDEVADVIGMVKALGLWDRVVAIEFDDEPGWTISRAKQNIKRIETAITWYGLLKPVFGYGVVEHRRNMMTTEGWMAFDWVGLEGYVDPPGSVSPLVNRKRLRRSMLEQYERLNGMPFMWVLQGYNRNGAWENEDTLAALQADSFSLMRSKPFVDTIMPIALVFAYSRPGGTKYLLSIKETHRSYIFGTRTREDRNG